MAEQPIPEGAGLEVQAIPIDSAGRYVVMLSIGRLLNREELESVRETLRRWWAGEEKFLVMSLVPGASVRFERVDPPE